MSETRADMLADERRCESGMSDERFDELYDRTIAALREWANQIQQERR